MCSVQHGQILVNTDCYENKAFSSGVPQSPIGLLTSSWDATMTYDRSESDISVSIGVKSENEDVCNVILVCFLLVQFEFEYHIII